MPVHRVPGGGRSSVWANPDELTNWLSALPSEIQAALSAPSPASVSLDASSLGVKGQTPVGTSIVTPTVLPIVAPKITPQVAPPVTRQVSSRGRRLALLAALAVVTVGATGSSIWKAETEGPPGTHQPYSDNPHAREIFMNAQFELSARTAGSLADAEREFRRVVEIDPKQAAGWSGLADTYLLLRQYGSIGDETAYPKAADAARTAIALDPKLADAWLDQAFVAYWWQDDPATAFRAFETALQLDPTSAKVFHWYGNALLNHGAFTKSLQMIARARALDPGSRAIVADEGWSRFVAGQRDEGLAILERLVHIDPQFVSSHRYLARAYLVQQKDSDFLREALVAAELRGQPEMLARLHLAQEKFQSGGRQAMLEQLAASEAQAWQQGSGSAVLVAGYRALARDEAGLYQWLAIAETQHDYQLPCLRVDPEFSLYREEPRFVAATQRLP